MALMLHSGWGQYELKEFGADVDAETSDEELVAAVAGKQIVVISLFFLSADTATVLTVQSNATALAGGTLSNAANGGASLDHNPGGWYRTVAGEALKVTTGAGSATAIRGTYIEV